MAIIGDLYKLQRFLEDKNLNVVFEYFKEALNKKSDTSKRIHSLAIGSFKRQNINDEVFAIEQVFCTKDREECFFESHQKYIDFQLVLSGNEMMEYIDKDKLEIDKAYDAEKDLIVYKLQEKSSRILLQAQDLAIYFPDDAHMGLAKYKESELVFKTVIKLPLDLWSNNAN